MLLFSQPSRAKRKIGIFFQAQEHQTKQTKSHISLPRSNIFHKHAENGTAQKLQLFLNRQTAEKGEYSTQKAER